MDTSADAMNAAEIFPFCQKEAKNKKLFAKIAMHLHNCLEDGYIENLLLERYPGKLGHALSFLREEHFSEAPNLTEMIEAEDDWSAVLRSRTHGSAVPASLCGAGHFLMTMFSLILLYAKFGKVKYGTTPISDARVQLLFSMLDDIDTAVLSPSFAERLKCTNAILVKLWPHIKDLIENTEDTEDGVEQVVTILTGIPGATAIGEGSTSPGTTGSPTESATASSRSETAKLAEKEDEESNAETDEDLPNTADKGSSSVHEVSPQDKNGRIPYQETDSLSDPMGGTTQYENAYAGAGYPTTASDIERILDKVAENDAIKELEENRTQELNQLAQEIEYGDIQHSCFAGAVALPRPHFFAVLHNGVDKIIYRMDEVPDYLTEAFDEAAPKLLPISKHLQKTIKDQLKDKRQGGKRTGLYYGRRLDTHALSRNDGRVFYKNNLPDETPELAVGLLLDESGSMMDSDRATYARASAVILHDFCTAMKTPIMIYGHTTGGYSVDLYAYAEFDVYDSKDKYRLMDISARGSNRDGVALRYMMDRLKKRPEEAKLLILVSDGQPADNGYFGSAAEADLRGIKKDCEKAGILLVAAAIGSDKECINRIYGDSYMDITDLSQLPIQLAGKIKRYIKM